MWRTSLRRAVRIGVLALGVTFAGFAHAASPIPDFDRPAPGTRMQLTSDSISYDRSGRVATATGNVVILYGGYRLTADRVSYDRRRRILAASGRVKMYDPGGTVFETHYIQLTDTFRDAFANRLRVLLTNEAVLTADRIERRAGNVTTLTNATYTRCKACEDDPSKPLVWQIKADKIVHDQRARTLAYEGAQFEFLGSTWLRLSEFAHADPTVSRKTGFLAPSFSLVDVYGAGVEVPFFWAIAPNMDLTLRPIISSKQGPIFQGEFRHRLANGSYSISPYGVYQFTDDRETPADTRFRGAVRSVGNFDINEYWRWGWDGTLVSDDTFLRRYDIDQRTDLISQAFVTGLGGRNYFSARAYHFRGLLLTDDNSMTPYVAPLIDHTHFFSEPIIGGELSLNNSFYSLHRDTGTDSTRIVSQLHWQRQITTTFGAVLTPFATLRGGVYYEDKVVDPLAPGGIRDAETVARVMPTGGVDARMPFIQNNQDFQQIFEPIAQVLFRPNETKTRKISNEDSLSFVLEETNLFDFNKFSGEDRWEGGSRANIGFNHTVLFSDGNYIKFTAGESFHLFGQNSFGTDTGLENDRSDFIAALQIRPSQYINFTGRVRLDDKTGDLRRADVSSVATFGRFTTLVHYTDADSRPALGETGHREEIFTELGIQVSKYWQVFGKARYDIAGDRRVANAIGVRYDDECFIFHLQYKEDFTTDRDVDVDRSITFRVELKTITTNGRPSAQ